MHRKLYFEGTAVDEKSVQSKMRSLSVILQMKGRLQSIYTGKTL
jgi:hypothetical protein